MTTAPRPAVLASAVAQAINLRILPQGFRMRAGMATKKLYTALLKRCGGYHFTLFDKDGNWDLAMSTDALSARKYLMEARSFTATHFLARVPLEVEDTTQLWHAAKQCGFAFDRILPGPNYGRYSPAMNAPYGVAAGWAGAGAPTPTGRIIREYPAVTTGLDPKATAKAAWPSAKDYASLEQRVSNHMVVDAHFDTGTRVDEAITHDGPYEGTFKGLIEHCKELHDVSKPVEISAEVEQVFDARITTGYEVTVNGVLYRVSAAREPAPLHPLQKVWPLPNAWGR